MPIACGLIIRAGGAGVKFVAHHSSQWLLFDFRNLSFSTFISELGTALLGIGLCALIVGAMAYAIERWGDPRAGARVALLVGSILIAGWFQPVEVVLERPRLLAAFAKIEVNRSTLENVHDLMLSESHLSRCASVYSPAKEQPSCTFQLTFEIPCPVGAQSLEVNFNQQFVVVSKAISSYSL